MPTRTNIVLDEQLVAQAMKRAGVKTKRAAVEAALKAYVRKPDYSGLLALVGTGVIADDYDPDVAYRRHPVEPPMGREPRTPFKATPAARKRKTAKR
jgi:Arc/MetJ family transcription regulator